MLENQADKGNFLCVGLDIDYDKIPESLKGTKRLSRITRSIVSYACDIIDATKPYACAFKPNIGFSLARMGVGISALQKIVEYAQLTAPEVIILLDGKPGDVDSTSVQYARGYLDVLQSDAVTLNPYMGQDSQKPFLDHPDKGCIVLCKTSNPGSAEFQDRKVFPTPEEAAAWKIPSAGHMPLYELIAHRVSKEWNANKNCGLVVGATFPEPMQRVRRIVGDDVFILAPGIGKQKGDLEATIKAAKNSKGGGFMINASSSICYASSGSDFQEAAAVEARRLCNTIRNYL
jgi:orotidine-5'-phosphate decarboxylase